MKAVFADTSFFVAFLSAESELYELAQEQMATYPGRLLTTVWVLVELGNYLSKYQARRLYVPFLRSLEEEHQVQILPITKQ
jgi:predicted nucleic acid-binding protein